MSEQQGPGLSTHQSLRIYLIVLGWSVLVLFFGIWLGSESRPEKASAVQAVQPEEEYQPRGIRADFPVEETLAEALLPSKSLADPVLPFSQLEEKKKVLKEDLYTIQVAAFKSVAEARSEVKNLLSKGYDARVVAPGLEGSYFKVWVGGFESEEESKKMETELKEAGFSTYVRKTDSSLSQ